MSTLATPVTMNRQQRRATRALIKKNIDPVTRVHEAGHAMGRIFTHPLMNWPIDELDLRIELGIVREVRADRVLFNNVTYGHLFSSDMALVFCQLRPDIGAEATTKATQEDFDAMRAAGCDLKVWLFARCVIELGGPVAEAKYTGEPIQDVLDKWELSDDVADLHRNVHWLRRKFLSRTMLGRAAAFLQAAFDQPSVWPTTLAVAKSLTAPGVTPNDAIMSTVYRHMDAIPAPSLDGLLQVKVRRDHNAMKVATYWLDDLDGWRWSDVSGGRKTKAPEKFLYAYAWCNDLLDGSINHTCEHGNGPHSIKVCVTRSDNPELWTEIGKEAAWAMRQSGSEEEEATNAR
jgi:hypothetical protein